MNYHFVEELGSTTLSARKSAERCRNFQEELEQFAEEKRRELAEAKRQARQCIDETLERLAELIGKSNADDREAIRHQVRAFEELLKETEIQFDRAEAVAVVSELYTSRIKQGMESLAQAWSKLRVYKRALGEK